MVHIFNLTTELVVTIVISTKEVKSEIETHPVTAEVKVSKCAM